MFIKFVNSRNIHTLLENLKLFDSCLFNFLCEKLMSTSTMLPLWFPWWRSPGPDSTSGAEARFLLPAAPESLGDLHTGAVEPTPTF